jgi:nucleoside-diphosphate kinase
MAVERTLSIIKPDAVEKGHTGGVIATIESSGLKLKAMKMLHLSRAQAEGFYHVHKDRGFFRELCEFMTRSPVVVICLEGENAIARYREVMGATDPAKAAPNTLRKKYGANIGENACHGSDAAETAAFEIAYFFPGYDLRG